METTKKIGHFSRFPGDLSSETIRNEKGENNDFFAEVIEGSLQYWIAQCWRWNQGVDFATLVAIEEKKRTIFGLVFHIETGSWQVGRTPMAYQKTEEELVREQPQIFELLRTNFKCLTVGYQEFDEIRYQYAPQPPKIHSFVRPATHNEITQFFSDDRYISMLFAAHQQYNLEELLLGLIRFRIRYGMFQQDQCNQFIDSFSLLTGNDYRRLKVFLHRLQPLLNSNNIGSDV
jgi:hypothetical protein